MLAIERSTSSKGTDRQRYCSRRSILTGVALGPAIGELADSSPILLEEASIGSFTDLVELEHEGACPESEERRGR